MSSKLLINCRPHERRVALIENGVTTELFFEKVGSYNLVGNLYKGRVVRVLPGMQAASVDVGLERAAFLFVADTAGAAAGPQAGDRRKGGSGYPPITELLRDGQEILVQVTNEPVGTKRARVSMQITLPGRHLVYAPHDDSVGVSRRIADPDERMRLRDIATELKPDKGGLTVRTAGEGAGYEELREDLELLVALWRGVEQRVAVVQPPELVHEDPDVTLRAVRDRQLDRVIVDDESEAVRIQSFVDRFAPEFAGTVDIWPGPDPLFERFGLEHEISRAVRRKVWLRSGGSIIIDPTEALTAIDVNTGRYVGGSSFAETVLDINLEAVREIAYQLRFRDIGGLVVIDFIDMEAAHDRVKVHQALVDAVADDRASMQILEMSQLGLIEMTRKRVRDSIVQSLTEPCYYCDGGGYLCSLRVITHSIMSVLSQRLVGDVSGPLHVLAHPRVCAALAEEQADELGNLERKYAVEIQIVDRNDMHLEQFEVS